MKFSSQGHFNTIFHFSFKESQDVQESFKHLEAWYDENVRLYIN